VALLKKILEKEVLGARGVDWILILILVVLAPFFVFPDIGFVWIYFLVPAVFVLRWGIERKFFERTIIDWPLGILLVWTFVGGGVVSDFWFGLPKIAGFIFGIFVFYGSLSILKRGEVIEAGLFSFLAFGGILGLVSGLGMKFSPDIFLAHIFTGGEEFFAKLNMVSPVIDMGFHGAEEKYFALCDSLGRGFVWFEEK
jgi:hypothetical protein